MLEGEVVGIGVEAGGVDLRGLMQILAQAGERISSDPEEVEARLRGVVSDAHRSLGLGYLGLDANVSEDLRVEVQEGCAARGAAFEEPLVRGSIRIGVPDTRAKPSFAHRPSRLRDRHPFGRF